MNDFKFELGQTVKDVITDIEGLIIYRTQWLTNCNTYGIRSKPKKGDNKVPDIEQMDEPTLIVIKKEMVKLDRPLKKARETGGPTDNVHHTNRQ